MNASIAKVADEQVAAEPSKIRRRQSEAPGRIEFTRRGNATNQVAGRVERIDETVSWARHIVFLVFILKRVGHIDSAADVLNSERRKSCGKVWIRESPSYRDGVKRAVENIDFTGMKISCIQQGTRGRTIDGQPLINSTVRRGLCVGDHGHDGHSSESRDGAVLAGEDKRCFARADTIVNDEPCAAVEDDAGRIALLAPHAWHSNRQRERAGTNVVDRGLA